MEKKSIPVASLQNVLPPNLDRTYFDDAATNPFQPQAPAFEPVNAWWLAETALLTYADEEFARGQFERAGLGQVAFVSNAGSQCYLVEGRDFVIAAFRGTQVPKPGATPDLVRGFEETVRDFLADVNIPICRGRPGSTRPRRLQGGARFDLERPRAPAPGARAAPAAPSG